MSRVRWLALVAGVGLFAWVLKSVDLEAVWGELRTFHWRFLMVLAFYGVIFGLDTLGWRYAFRPKAGGGIRWNRLFRARLAGEAVNYITPAAWIGGEPVKAALLSSRYGVPLAEGMASVVVAKTTFVLSMLLFVAVGLSLTAATQPLPVVVMKWVWVVLPTLSVLVALMLLVQFLRPFRRALGVVGRVAPRWLAGVASKMEQWDQALFSFYKDSPRLAVCSLGFHFLGWVAGAVEVYLIFKLLQFPVSLSTACSIEALWVLLKGGAFLIPASLGASEGIVLFVCAGVGIGAVPALALALIRRARELAWVALGLAEFARG